MKRELLDNGNIWQKSDGRWIGLVRYKDEFGVTQRKSFSSKKKKTLQAKMTEYVKNFNEQIAKSDDSRKPLKESMKNWLRVYKFPEVERTTYDRYEDSVYDLALTPAEACEVSGIKPKVHCDENTVGVQMLAGGGKTLIFLTNKSAARETNSCRLRLNFEYNRATIHTFDGEGTLSVSGKEIAVENFTDGAIVEIEYR